MVEFPKGFLWGAATSSYQVEGNNNNSDWWEWENRIGVIEKSGRACRHYELYKEDFDLAKELAHNAHRLSIEWSRIEPEEGKFSSREIQHYQEVVLSLKERNIEPIITLHHFSLPIWFAKLGGFKNKDADKYFLRYVETVVDTLCSNVRFWITINEPLVYIYHAYILGVWPPQEKSLSAAGRVYKNLTALHIQAYRLIHRIYKRKNLPACSVSLAKNLQAFEPCGRSLKNKFAAFIRDQYYNIDLLRVLKRNNSLDFIGINYYTRALIEADSWHPRNLLLDTCRKNHSNLEKNSLGWDIYPEGLYNLLLRLKRFGLPILITENGICTEDDKQRWEFIYNHLSKLYAAMEQGVKIFGYLHWSLLDNFEWDKGFSPRFGLISVDYATYKRTIKESARKFAQACRTGLKTEA